MLHICFIKKHFKTSMAFFVFACALVFRFVLGLCRVPVLVALALSKHIFFWCFFPVACVFSVCLCLLRVPVFFRLGLASLEKNLTKKKYTVKLRKKEGGENKWQK
jgi:hypothetical protein